MFFIKQSAIYYIYIKKPKLKMLYSGPISSVLQFSEQV